MKKIAAKITYTILSKLIGIQNIEKAILFLAKLSGIDPLLIAYHNIGVLKYENLYISGEHKVIGKLEEWINKEKPLFFDIGAHIGNYSKELRAQFPKAEIYSFEPNTHTFEEMSKELTALDINCFNIGFGPRKMKVKLYTYANTLDSSHTSIYKDVFLDMHKTEIIAELWCEIITLDEFCNSNDINFIDFMKVDTEGFELEVLKGAKKMISEDKIGIIQFEFNEMNIVSRTFLRDFYKVLSNYDIYRVDSNRLIPLLEYSSRNEIFAFQNFLAINEKCIAADRTMSYVIVF